MSAAYTQPAISSCLSNGSGLVAVVGFLVDEFDDGNEIAANAVVLIVVVGTAALEDWDDKLRELIDGLPYPGHCS